MTDHNTIDGALAARELAPNLIIVGEEIATTGGEVIAYFLHEAVPAGLSPHETIARVHSQGGLAGVSHPMEPFRREAMQLDALMLIVREIDCLEVFNARVLLPASNRRALAFARAHGIPRTAGSDAHSVAEIGRAWVETRPYRNPGEFLEVLRLGEIVGRLSCPLVHLTSTYAKARRRLGERDG